MRPEARRKSQQAGDLGSSLSPKANMRSGHLGRSVSPGGRNAANDETASASTASHAASQSAVSDSRLSDLLDSIAVSSAEELQIQWSNRTGGAAPQVPEELLRLLLAYHVQEETLGGLDKAVAHELDLAAQSDGAHSHTDVSGFRSEPQPAEPAHGKGARKGSQAVPASPAIGTRLIREWNGQTIRVDVREEGFVWNGAVYASLSAIARAVTGARWSGPRFFALDGGRRRG